MAVEGAQQASKEQTVEKLMDTDEATTIDEAPAPKLNILFHSSTSEKQKRCNHRRKRHWVDSRVKGPPVQCQIRVEGKCIELVEKRLHTCPACGIKFCDPCYKKVLNKHISRGDKLRRLRITRDAWNRMSATEQQALEEEYNDGQAASTVEGLDPALRRLMIVD